MANYGLNATLSATPVTISFGGGAATYAFTAADTGSGTGAAVDTTGTAKISTLLGGVSDLSSGSDVGGNQIYGFSASPTPAVIPNSATDDFIGLSFTLADGLHYGYAELSGPALVSYGYDATPGATIQTGAVDTAPQPGLISYKDTTSGQAAQEQAQAYAGPVNYLQSQFIWSGPDSANLTSNTPNVFLRGGPGEDALKVVGGSNVLDGGTGSNFLVGGNGQDGGTDTFFIDGRGSNVTWSTIDNFHHGDAVTLYGFTGGTSTLPAYTTDGAAGYQGATIHSEIRGPGTGVNGSMTFAGINAADAASKFTTSTGTVGGIPYLYVAYTGT